MKNQNPTIQIEEVGLGYNQNNPIFPSFSLKADERELIALVGRNGVGKSTFLRTLAGLQQKLWGQITIMGFPLQSLSRRVRAKFISYVPSEAIRVPNLQIRSFVAVGRFPHSGWAKGLSQLDWDMVDNALKMVGIEDLAKRDITEVSDGERQRAMIAFALAQDTKIIIMDEPTAFLDLPNKFEMVRLLSKLAHNQEKTVIYSTHDLQGAIGEADTIWMMLESGFVAGIPEELILSKQISRLLTETNVFFDSKTGVFRNTRESETPVLLMGEGNATFWTRRMLERMGFVTTEVPTTPIKIICSTLKPSPTWTILYEGNQIFQAKSISDLANWLKENKRKYFG